uniref:CRAL-TRIO domain-containing protein n=1 Tax=Mucochytrium quahogii TaxID=96639 RepID=A0A7S2SPG6_9STRA|mmetsp:Transcript_10865/g.17802  ORF Transcript_10865/g.17802 Transcript_10865/m.17802 type:complete len:409 (+) Transcript_10865:315-1541(+)|eukprot:CAMPEP_0203748320 /NCGR_PEP_ID=MMETSP0098-20131031/3241_1 /ASSEMBLY_ACC=CAM_ASM_000208 /TAXON_ID=96639 /ORGANISM=" , Strain NY0313808BC1" /LENGTH=408 /DNA_ID=CAMNT_0050637031 /DNA_START=234 /DNA_END=1460 /DNA_ORIENTATION=-
MGHLESFEQRLSALNSLKEVSDRYKEQALCYVEVAKRAMLAFCMTLVVLEAKLLDIDNYRASCGSKILFYLVMVWYVVFDVETANRTQIPSKTQLMLKLRRSTTSTLVENEVVGDEDIPLGTEGDVEYKGVVDGWVIKTQEELEKVLALRGRLQDIAPFCTERPLDMSDVVLIRFVRARKKLDESEALYRETFKWRQETKPQVLLAENRWPPEEMMKYMTGGWCGVDKEGTPIWVDRIGQLDVPVLVTTYDAQEFVNLVILRQELHTQKMIESEKERGVAQYQLTVIQDMTGLSMRHYNKVGMAILKKCAYVNDTYYPERLKFCAVVNAPRLFSVIYNVVKYFFHPNTRAKITVHSDSGALSLLKRIDADVLPAFLGGSREIDGDPYCSAIIAPGGRIPKGDVKTNSS